MSRAKKLSKSFWNFLDESIEKVSIDSILDSVSFLREKALSDIEEIKAQVDGEDLWFTCHQSKRDDNSQEGMINEE